MRCGAGPHDGGKGEGGVKGEAKVEGEEGGGYRVREDGD